MKKSTKQKICLALLGFMLSNGFPQMISPALAAEAKIEKDISATEATNSYDAVSFTERIKKILADGEKARNAILQGGDNDKKVDRAPQSASEVSPPVPLQPSERSVEQQPYQQIPAPVQTGNVYDFDWQGTPLAQTLYAISKISGKRVVINGQLTGTVYTSLSAVTYDKALDYLAKSFNFNWMLDDDGEAIIISTSDLMKQSKVFDVRFADKDKLKAEMVSRGIDEKNIYVNNEYSSISVTGTPYQLSQAAKLIAGTDKPVSQCLMIAQLIEISHGKDLNLGMQYSLPTYTHPADDTKANSMAGKFIDKLTFSASAEANRALSKGKVVARPMIMSKNGQEATVSMGDSVPIQSSTTTASSTQVTFDYKDIGTTLKITPIINDRDGEVNLTIDANISNISKWITSGTFSAPQISSRKATTNVHLKSGQSFVIGGLMSSKDLDNLSGIPGLMNLPILGNLFRYHSISRENTEVFIMVTPYIVGEDTDPKALLREVK